jgi:hypothetical protein
MPSDVFTPFRSRFFHRSPWTRDELQRILAPPALTLPEETRFAGHWVVAPPGRGKTTLLHTLVMDDLQRDAALVIIDSKGDLIDPIKNLASINERLILIEPDPDSAFALNPLDVSGGSAAHAVSLIEYIMAGLLDAKFTGLQSTLFRNTVPAIIEAFPHPTLYTFKEVMVKGLSPAALEKVNPHVQRFFEDRETGFNSKTYDSTRKEVVWRLDYLLTNPVMRSMFSSPHTKLDLGKEIDGGKVIIINNSKAILGDEGAEFFGRFFIALIARAAQQRAGRSPERKRPCYVYIDECQSVIAKDARIPTLLDECRSQKIALILAHQRIAQLTPPVLDAVANCAIRMANSDDDARSLAPKLRTTPEMLQTLNRGEFATFIRDTTPTAIVLKVGKPDFSKLRLLSPSEVQARREKMREQWGVTAANVPEEPIVRSEERSTAVQSAGPDRAAGLKPKAPAPKTPSPRDPDTGEHTEPAPEWDK